MGFSHAYGAPTEKGEAITNIRKAYDKGYTLFDTAEVYESIPYALYITLPGYQGLYFQGVAQNIKTGEFGFEAQKYNDQMIIVAPQLSDWRETSARQTRAVYSGIDVQFAVGWKLRCCRRK